MEAAPGDALTLNELLQAEDLDLPAVESRLAEHPEEAAGEEKKWLRLHDLVCQCSRVPLSRLLSCCFSRLHSLPGCVRVCRGRAARVPVSASA